MSDPILRSEDGAPPLPILGEAILEQGGEMERTWKNAPSIVRDARLLAVLGIVFYAIFAMIGVAQLYSAMIGDDRNGHGASGSVVVGELAGVALYVGLIVLEMWLIRSFRQGRRAAWTIELILAIIGLIGIPVGTIISIYILVKWFQPETKRWFGIST